MGVSIAKFDTLTKAEAGIDIDLIDTVTGLPSGIVFIVKGTDSKAYKQAKAKKLREALERARKGEELSESDDAVHEFGSVLLAACTVGWKNLDDEAGNPIEFSPTKAKELYDTYPMIREQIDRAIADRQAFIKG